METKSSKNCFPSNGCTTDLDLFFSNGLYNSCQATDELIKSIEESQDEALARRALVLYQRHYTSLERPYDHVNFMYGLGLLYMHFNAYNWTIRAFREAIYIQPTFDRSRDVHTRLALIFKATKRYKLSEKHFKLAINDTRSNSDCALVPSQATNVTSTNHISAEELKESSKNSPKPRKIDINLVTDEERPPIIFPRAPPYPPVPPDKLLPLPSSIFLETKKGLLSTRLQEFCQLNPISIVRNIGSVLKLDLGLFSTKSLVECNPDQLIEVVGHLLEQTTENVDIKHTNIWSCERKRSLSTISRYANYQVGSFRESLLEEKETKTPSTSSKTSLNKESETDSNESASAQAKRSSSNNTQAVNVNSGTKDTNNKSQSFSPTGSASKKIKIQPPKDKFVRSADKVDLSDDKKWRAQLHELNKLPNFIKCVSASNMLTHIGAPLQGVNTISMSMHVPGCRILGNKAPNNFCPVNINVGPGDYEWYAISSEYASTLAKLCTKNGFSLDGENWWPRLSDLQKYNIPVYRFAQRPGDLVWVNSGTIYWVQAMGWCNNIQWNVGPLCGKQYKLSSESFEINKFLFKKSEVPMIQLTWNIVINVNIILEDALHRELVDVMRRSLTYCLLVKDLIEGASQTIQLLDNQPGPKMAKFCSLCECEAFNIYLVRKSDNSLHCAECARRFDPTFSSYEIKQEYSMDYLMRLYDSFRTNINKYKEAIS